MFYVKAYLIRHQKRGILTDRVYLTPPSREEFNRRVSACGEGWSSVVETVAVLPDQAGSVAGCLNPIPAPVDEEPRSSVSTGGAFPGLKTEATGTVTLPKR